MTKKVKAEPSKAETKGQKKPEPAAKPTKPAKKPIESIGLKAMRAVNLNADDEPDGVSAPAPKQVKKVLPALSAVKEEPTIARAVEVSNGRISLESALNNIADQRRIMAQNVTRPQPVEKPIIKELAALQRK